MNNSWIYSWSTPRWRHSSVICQWLVLLFWREGRFPPGWDFFHSVSFSGSCCFNRECLAALTLWSCLEVFVSEKRFTLEETKNLFVTLRQSRRTPTEKYFKCSQRHTRVTASRHVCKCKLYTHIYVYYLVCMCKCKLYTHIYVYYWQIQRVIERKSEKEKLLRWIYLLPKLRYYKTVQFFEKEKKN